jgi:mannose-6-phosphate isomerase
VLYPLRFTPIFKERIWGGRSLEQLYGKSLPPDVPIGESWEISDRPGDESVVSHGPLAGKTLRWLMEHHRADLLGGAAAATSDRFPLLCKILDARETLSVQVHPPAVHAARLGGEPKTEMWYIAAAAPGAELYVGLKNGVSDDQFRQAINSGSVAECLHRVRVARGDVMFLPSGRVHAIGAGLVIFEIQQNSDTTYRVFDWNRVDRDGRPRELHVGESLASIDFSDAEPRLAGQSPMRAGHFAVRRVVEDPLFTADIYHAPADAELPLATAALRIVAVIAESLTITSRGSSLPLESGTFGLIPASVADAVITAPAGSEFMVIDPSQDS